MTDTHKVALLRIHGSYDSDYSELIQYVSEWEEVTKEELALLKRASGDYHIGKHPFPYLILEFPKNQSEIIKATVKAQLEAIRKEEEEKEKRKREAAAKALARKHKLDLKKAEEKRKLYEQLKEELGEK